MTGPNHKYEIFIKSSTRPVDGGMMRSIWSWRKTDAAGFALVRGADHGSMVECLRAARAHRGKSDDAPIAIELQAREAPDAAEVVYLGKKVGDGAAHLAESGFGSGPISEQPVGAELPSRLDEYSLREREQRYVRREEDARNRAAQTEDSDLRNEFLQSARVYAELIGSLRRERAAFY